MRQAFTDEKSTENAPQSLRLADAAAKKVRSESRGDT
jgi:hypothetical protein